MSSMAKIFVVVNLVIIVAVFGSAATLLGAQDDYRKALTETANKARDTHAKQKKMIDDARAQTASQRTKAINEMNRANDAEQRFEMAKANSDSANQINVSNGAALERLSGEYNSLRKLYEGQAEMIKTLQSSAKDADQNYTDKNTAWERAVKEAAQRANRIAELDDSVRTLQAEHKAKMDELRTTKFWLEEMEKRFGSIRGEQIIDVEGRVLEVREAVGGVVIVIISIGREDKVTVGSEFKISRGRDFVGFAKVTRVMKNSAVAEFDTRFAGKGAPVRSGDRAYSR